MGSSHRADPRGIPPRIRDAVIERDNQTCRICGRWVEYPGVHHIVFKSQGGLDVPSNLITVGWTPYDHDCHLPVAHGANARSWREIFLAIADRPGITAYQAKRWVEQQP